MWPMLLRISCQRNTKCVSKRIFGIEIEFYNFGDISQLTRITNCTSFATIYTDKNIIRLRRLKRIFTEICFFTAGKSVFEYYDFSFE